MPIRGNEYVCLNCYLFRRINSVPLIPKLDPQFLIFVSYFTAAVRKPTTSLRDHNLCTIFSNAYVYGLKMYHMDYAIKRKVVLYVI